VQDIHLLLSGIINYQNNMVLLVYIVNHTIV